MSKEQEPKIGDSVMDIVTEQSGVIIGVTEWLTGCKTLTVESVSLDGKQAERFYPDINRVTILKRQAVKTVEWATQTEGTFVHTPGAKGGPQPAPQRNTNPLGT